MTSEDIDFSPSMDMDSALGQTVWSYKGTLPERTSKTPKLIRVRVPRKLKKRIKCVYVSCSIKIYCFKHPNHVSKYIYNITHNGDWVLRTHANDFPNSAYEIKRTKC